jgi:hypothetical protein
MLLNEEASRAFSRLVKSATPLTRLLLALTVLAFAVVQVFGGNGGYLCVCGGETTIVAVDHCHGPHGVQCHDDQTDDRHRDTGTQGDTEQHPPVKIDLKGCASEVSAVVVTAPVLVAVFVFDAVSEFLTAATGPRKMEVGESPPPSIAVVRSVVFLI